MADDATKKVNVTSLKGAVGGDSKDTEKYLMDEYLGVQKEIKTRFELLPDDLKKLMTSDDYQKSLFEVAKANKLTFEELSTLEIDTSMVILGMTPPNEYRDELKKDLKLEDTAVDSLVAMLNEKIFNPIRASLERVYSAKRDPADFLPDPEETEPAQTPSTPAVQNITGITPKPVTPPVSTPTPVAPAPIAPKPAPVLSTQEKSMLEKTGVVISETPAPVKDAPLGSRTDILQGIENPTKTAPTNLVADKLKAAAPVMAPTKTTDYTIAKPSTPTTQATPPVKSSVDPYREPIG